MNAPIHRQILTFNRAPAASRDIGALHQLVMSGYFHALEGGHDDARSRLDNLFLAQRPAPNRTSDRYPPPARGTTKVLVQANTVGDWSRVDPHLGVSASEPIPVDLSAKEGDVVEVQTLVNPTRSLPPEPRGDGTFARGKRVVLTHTHEIAEWFTRTMNRNGLDLAPHAIAVGSPERLSGRRTKGNTSSPLNVDVRLLRGEGRVTDPDAFAQMLITGIGRGRPYGAGLVRHRHIR